MLWEALDCVPCVKVLLIHVAVLYEKRASVFNEIAQVFLVE